MRFKAAVPFTFANGAIGWAPGGPFDVLGPYAKVEQCPIDGTDIKRTCYATGLARDAFSVPARTRYRGKHIGGCLTVEDGACLFIPYSRFLRRLDDVLIREE